MYKYICVCVSMLYIYKEAQLAILSKVYVN